MGGIQLGDHGRRANNSAQAEECSPWSQLHDLLAVCLHVFAVLQSYLKVRQEMSTIEDFP